MKIYEAIARTAGAYHRCIASGNTEWRDRHAERMDTLAALLPSGSGIDCGTEIVVDETTDSRIVLSLSFHHMNDNGCYDGWTEHRAIITPTFGGISIRITGRDRNGIKEYLGDILHAALSCDAPTAETAAKRAIA